MKAMVLCAGYGTRLGDLTREIPKPMLPLGERPMLEFIIRHLKRHGFDELAVNLHFMPEMIPDYFGDGSRWGVRLHYSLEPELLGTAGGAKKMEAFLRGSGPFLVQYGDMVTSHDFTAMMEFHRQRKGLATLLVHERAKSNSAIAVDAQGCIERFLERPTESERSKIQTSWVFSGAAICETELLDRIPPDTFCDFPRDLFAPMAEERRFHAFPLSGHRCAVDSPERLAEARRGVSEGHFRLHD